MKTLYWIYAIVLLLSASPDSALAQGDNDCALPKGPFKLDYGRSVKGSWVPVQMAGHMGIAIKGFEAIDATAEREWIAANHTPYPRYTLQPSEDCSTLRFYYPLPDEGKGTAYYRAPTDAECKESMSSGLSTFETPFFVCVDFKVYKNKQEAEGQPKPNAYWDKGTLVTQEVTKWGKAPFEWRFKTEGKKLSGYYKMGTPAAWGQPASPVTEEEKQRPKSNVRQDEQPAPAPPAPNQPVVPVE